MENKEVTNGGERESLPPADRVVSALVCTPFEEEICALEAIFARSNWRLQHAPTLPAALPMLERQTFPVFLYGPPQFPGAWRTILDVLRGQRPSPRLIMMTRFSEAHRWGELLEAGVHDILPTPLNATEVVQVVGFAWLLWKHEWVARQAALLVEQQEPPLPATRRARYRHARMGGLRLSQGAGGA